MIAPGDPLEFFEDHEVYSRALAYYEELGFTSLGEEVLEVIANAKWAISGRELRHGEIRRLWTALVLRRRKVTGQVGMVESRGQDGKTAIFQFLFVSGNDGRYLYALTVGVFPPEALQSFRLEHGGIPERGA